MNLHVFRTVELRVQRPRLLRQEKGKAKRNDTNGRLKARSGAATTMSISCCAMCAEKSASPSSCNGETNATTSDSHPSQKQSACHGRIAELRRFRRRTHTWPRQ